MSNSDDKKMPLPTFSGMGMPMNVMINIDEDDVGEEVTRRIGGMPSFQPSFEPVSFAPTFSSAGPSISTAPVKASTTAISPTAPSNWKLTDATVLPEFHPLERTAVFCPHTSPSEVASRVSTVLKERSIQADFDDCKAKCMTVSNVDFRVFLYRGKKQYGHGIIVEVQRRSGNSIDFYNDVQAILDGAEGKKSTTKEGPPTKKLKTTLPSVPADNDDEVVSSSSLDFVAKMLTHTGHDAQYLALQTLSSLTDSDKMGMNTAGGVAKVLLTSGNEVGTKVFDMIVSKSEEAHDSSDNASGIRLMAMAVLCNVVKALNGTISDHMRALLRPVMICELQQAEQAPQMAFITSQCLLPLLPYYSSEDSELYGALRGALQVGKEKHAGLAAQAEECLQAMDR